MHMAGTSWLLQASDTDGGITNKLLLIGALSWNFIFL